MPTSSAGATGRAACSIYIHDPGAYSNVAAMAVDGERWSQLDHSWYVALWLHTALSRYGARAATPENADVIFIAHYFLHSNPVEKPLNFGSPLFAWDKILHAGGPHALFNNDTRLLRRWKHQKEDFVAAPMLIACRAVPVWLRSARWVILDQFIGNACGYRHGDLMAPYVPSDKWPVCQLLSILQPLSPFSSIPSLPS